MKKIIALAIIAIFVFSLVPLAFAEESKDGIFDRPLVDGGALGGVNGSPRAKDIFKNVKKEAKKTAREELNLTKGDLKKAREQGDEKAVISHSKTYLLKIADIIINHLEKIKIKIQESEHIQNEQKLTIIAQIDANIAEVKALKAEVEASSTKEQIKFVSKKLHDEWKRLRHLINFYSERVISARVEGIINRVNVLEKRLEKVLEISKKKGIEANVSAEMKLFNDRITTAEDKYEQSQAKLSEALSLVVKGREDNIEEIKALRKSANELLKQSRTALKEAHEILKGIVKKIKEAKVEVSADAKVEVAEEPAGTEASANTTAAAST